MFDFTALLCECSRTTEDAHRGRFIQTLTEKSIAIQNMRGQGYYRTAKDDKGSKKDKLKKSKIYFVTI